MKQFTYRPRSLDELLDKATTFLLDDENNEIGGHTEETVVDWYADDDDIGAHTVTNSPISEDKYTTLYEALERLNDEGLIDLEGWDKQDQYDQYEYAAELHAEVR